MLKKNGSIVYAAQPVNSELTRSPTAVIFTSDYSSSSVVYSTNHLRGIQGDNGTRFLWGTLQGTGDTGAS